MTVNLAQHASCNVLTEHSLHCCAFSPGVRTMSALSSTLPATSVTTCPSGKAWRPSPLAVTPTRFSNLVCLKKWLPEHLTASRQAAAPGGNASAVTTCTALWARSACRHWHSRNTRHAGSQAFCSRRPEGLNKGPLALVAQIKSALVGSSKHAHQWLLQDICLHPFTRGGCKTSACTLSAVTLLLSCGGFARVLDRALIAN